MTDATYLLSELEAAESWHFWFQARRHLVSWTRSKYFADAGRLLDVGCGTGFILEGLREGWHGARLFGCDRQAEPLAVAKRRECGAHLFQAEADRIPAHQKFDVILALDVIEHIDNDDAALAGMFDALRPGGGLILTVPQHPWLWSAVDDFSHHRRRYIRSELRHKVTVAGFELVRSTSLFMSTLPLLLVSRRRPRDRFDPSQELRLSRLINSLLGGVMAVEQMTIRAGVSLPVGGSLLVVARRPV